jgi:hypothetical protein
MPAIVAQLLRVGSNSRAALDLTEDRRVRFVLPHFYGEMMDNSEMLLPEGDGIANSLTI